MCATCGCSDYEEIVITDMQTGWHVHVHDDPGHHHDHSHPAHDHHDHHDHHSHEHSHARPHLHSSSGTVRLEQEVLARNSRLAERNRGWFAGRNILALNLMSSPGAGKTTLLERMISDLASDMTFAVIEGDQATLNDAERIRKTGCRVVQINTGAACHLDAQMVAAALRQLNPTMNSIVLIENVGNLVCPAMFDLGEHARVLVASVTEGDDKPQKYPHMFRSANVVLLNKIDLLPHVQFNSDRFTAAARELNPAVRVFPISGTQGTGLEQWYGWLQDFRMKSSDL